MNRSSLWYAVGMVVLVRFIAWLAWLFLGGDQPGPSLAYGAAFVCTYAHCEWDEFKKEWQEFKKSSSRKD